MIPKNQVLLEAQYTALKSWWKAGVPSTVLCFNVWSSGPFSGINFRPVHCLRMGHFMFLWYIYLYIFKGGSDITIIVPHTEPEKEVLRVCMISVLSPSVLAAHSTACLACLVLFLTCIQLLSVSVPEFPVCFRTCPHINDLKIKMCNFLSLEKGVNSLRLNSTHICTFTCAVWSGAPAVSVSAITFIYQI